MGKKKNCISVIKSHTERKTDWCVRWTTQLQQPRLSQQLLLLDFYTEISLMIYVVCFCSVWNTQTSMCYSGTGDVRHRRFISGARCRVVQQHTDSLTRTDDTLNRNKEPTRRVRSGVNDMNRNNRIINLSRRENVALHRVCPPVLVLSLCPRIHALLLWL